MRVASLSAYIGVVALLSFCQPAAQATTLYQQGFETDTAGWDVFGGTLDATRVPSGTGGITSASGSFHATGTTAATNWGGYSSVFPTGGYTTSLDIYLDLGATTTNDTRFDFTSAINDSSGNHLRDFAFNGGFYNDTDATGSGSRFVFSASNNTGRANSFPKNPGRDPFAITSSGWYTFEETFYDNGGVLNVDLSILDSSSALLHSWTLTTTDAIGTVGGNRYGWFANDEFSSLAFDNATLKTNGAAVPLPAAATGGVALLGLVAARRRRNPELR